MPARPPDRKARCIVRIALALGVATALVVAPLSGTATATAPAERRLHRLINGSRSVNGLRGLALSTRLSRAARVHSARLADQRALYHSCLSCRFPAASLVGETVGYAGTLRQIHRMMMNSPAHRDIILKRGFNRVGIGVVQWGGLYWATEIFMG